MSGKVDYATSRDYDRLWELLADGATVIVRGGRDERTGRYPRWTQKTATITPGGYVHVNGVGRGRFLVNCNRRLIEFIDPASQREGGNSNFAHVAASPETLAEFLRRVTHCQLCPAEQDCTAMGKPEQIHWQCLIDWMNWLKQESEVKHEQ